MAKRDYKTLYQKKLQKLKEAALRKESRLKKRFLLRLTKAKQPRIKDLKKTLKTVTHRIVRMKYTDCYSCGKYLDYKVRQAGHFWTDGGHAGVRYDFDNLRTQCAQCNYHKGGDADYASKLLQDIGVEKFRDLEKRARILYKWQREELIKLIEERTAVLQEMEETQNLNN